MKTFFLTAATSLFFLCGYTQVRNSSIGISSNTTSIQQGTNMNSNSSSSYSNHSSTSDNRYNDRNINNNSSSNTNSNYGINSNSNSNNSSSWNNSNSNNWNSQNNYYNSNNYTNNNSNYNNNYGTYTTNSGYKTKNENYGENIVSESPLIQNNNPFNTLNRSKLYNTNNPINRLFSEHQKPSQKFIINPQISNTLKANDGTIIKIQANSFIDRNGDVVTGEVEFEVKEIYGKGDMITSNAHTISNDMILESGGELYMDASRNSDPLMLAFNKPIQVEMPTTGNGDMQLFYGRPDGNSVNWTLANNNSVAPISNNNVSTGNSYNFNVNALGWMNCDKFRRNRGANTKINVRVPSQFDSTNTAVYIVFKGQNSVTRCDYYDLMNTNDQGQFSTRWYSVPVGAEVTLVAISEINGEVYSASKPVIITANMTEELTFIPTTMDIFKANMAKLP